MRTLFGLGAAAIFMAQTIASGAAELESGLKAGDPVGAFQVVKQGGIDDGVKIGKQLCYR